LRRLCRAFMSDDQNIETFNNYFFQYMFFVFSLGDGLLRAQLD
jgi:hypothetical protein